MATAGVPADGGPQRQAPHAGGPERAFLAPGHGSTLGVESWQTPSEVDTGAGRFGDVPLVENVQPGAVA